MRSSTLFMVAAGLLGGTAGAIAQPSGPSVLIREAVTEDLYVAGERIRILAPIAGDVVAAGASVVLEAPIEGDLIAAGEQVRVDAEVADDVRAAGSEVRIGAPVGGHVVAAGEQVVVAAGQRVESWAWLAGERIEVAGSVGSLKAAGAHIIVTGEIRGDAELVGEHIEIGPGAVIAGDLVWRSPSEPLVDEASRIGGRSVREPLPEPEGWGAAGTMIFLVAAILAVVAVRLLLPGVVSEVSRTAREAWLPSIGLGLVVLLVVPVVDALLFISTVGWLLGLILLLAYGLVLLVGGLLGLHAVSAQALALAGRTEGVPLGLEIAAIAGTVLVIALLAFIPFLWLLWPLVFLLGVGALARRLLSRSRSGSRGA